MPGDNSAVAEAPKGMDKLLKDMNLNFFEFAILSAFWVGVIIVSSFISLEGVLSFPPIAMALSLTSIGASYVPVASSVLGLLVMLYMSFKHRQFVGKAVSTVFRKITRRR